MITLVAIRHLEIDGHVFSHGAEIVPGLLAKETVDRLIDEKRVKEYDNRDRRSLYRLFSCFSGVSEKEQLEKDELDTLTLPK